MNLSRICVLLMFLTCLVSGCSTDAETQKQPTTGGDFYELRTYHVKDTAQEQIVEKYLEQAFLPTLHRAGWQNIGVFKPIESDTVNFGKRVFVLIPAHSLGELEQLPQILLADKQHEASGKAYWDAQNANPPYERIETSWLSAFSGNPKLQVPDIKTSRNERIYEIRSYESPTEKLHVNKVHMFNVADEIALFKKLGFNPVFFGDVLSGARMPNLVYMIAFDNQAAKDAHWKAFGDSPEWKAMTALPEYKAENISHIDSYPVHPTNYSDF